MNLLENKIKNKILEKPSITLDQLIALFYKDPKSVELFAIIFYIFGEEPNHFAKEIRQNKTDHRILELIDDYGDYDHLSELFIESTVLSAFLYKKKNKIEQSKKIIEAIAGIERDYYDQVYDLKNRLFTNEISIRIDKCDFNMDDVSGWMQEQIMNKNISPSSTTDENLLNFDHFTYFRVNHFSVIENSSLVNDLIVKITN